MDYQLTKIKLELEKELSCSTHDLEHIDRIYKLFIKNKKLSEQLFTDKAKKIADKRIKIMSDFFRLLEEEITGED